MRRLGALYDLRQERRDERRATGDAKMAAAEGKTSGTLVVEAKNLAVTYGERKIIDNFSTRIMRGDRIGIVGPNGAGKTTLLSILTGTQAPDSGIVRLGAALETVTLDQHRDSLDPNDTLQNALTEGRGDFVTIGGVPRHVIGYLKDFLFSPEQARTPLRVLSGGERGRVMLARALAKPSNLLVLDEPTNDLDLETLDVLEEMLGDYSGTIIVISHDRDFLDRVATSVIAPEGNGVWMEYAGGYTDMLAQRGEALAETRGVARSSASKRAAWARDNAEPEPGAVAKPASKRRLNFNETHALSTLPKRIADLGKEIATLQKRLGDPNLFARDPKVFDRLSADLARKAGELEAAETQWLELEILRDEVGA